MKASGLCPKLAFVKTTASQNRSKKKQKPDISIYWKLPGDKHDGERGLDFKAVDLWIENKNQWDDIFRTLTERRKTRRRMVTWIVTSGGRIPLTKSVDNRPLMPPPPIIPNSASFPLASSSLLRWDRSGVIYTEAFQWKTQPDTLFEFFWRLNFLSPVDRGYDTTITPVVDDDDEVQAALSKLRKYEGWEDGEKLKITNLYRILVRDDCATDGQLRSYITPGAIWDTNALFGRCTFGYIAYDVAASKLVYLKDFWRTNLPRI